MGTALLSPVVGEEIERVLVGGDLAKLSPDQRVKYYRSVCESIGLNPLTRPFDYLNLNGKLVLYARKDCADQLRAIKGVSIPRVEHSEIEGLYIVTAYARTKEGREDADTGAVNIATLKGEARANAIMKATTKAKRRVTLSICGLGYLDENEIETVPGAYRVVVDDTGEVKGAAEGTKEAQQEYLQRRLAEVKKPGPVPDVVREFADIDPAETPLHLEHAAPTPERPIAAIEMRSAAQVAEAEAVLNDAGKPAKRKRGAISFEALKKWGELKKDLRAATGTDTVYYSALKAKGYDHADEIRTEADAISIWKVLGAELNRLKQNTELLATLEHASEVIGIRALTDLLGVHGCETMHDVLSLAGDPLAALLAELKTKVDQRKGAA